MKNTPESHEFLMTKVSFRSMENVRKYVFTKPIRRHPTRQNNGCRVQGFPLVRFQRTRPRGSSDEGNSGTVGGNRRQPGGQTGALGTTSLRSLAPAFPLGSRVSHSHVRMDGALHFNDNERRLELTTPNPRSDPCASMASARVGCLCRIGLCITGKTRYRRFLLRTH